ncbi:MAG: response regulator transcription factor [Bradyrhizobiaceae bacterium]|nr:response regulator transcription factor [Bradyrhizobiaceae bacterium]
MKKSVLIADDHPIFRSGLRKVIEESRVYDVIGEVNDGETCVAQAELLKPDIMIVDLNMPRRNGFAVVEWARRNLPRCRTIVVSMYSGKDFVQQAMEIGASAFVAKEDADAELLKALDGGGTSFFLSSSAGRGEAPPGFGSHSDSKAQELISSLTGAEKKVLRLVAQSMTSRDIANALGIGERTVHTHRQNISSKLELKGSNSLLQFAIRNRSVVERMT